MTKAIGFSAYGGADVLHPIEIDLPAPGPGQVRVAVRTAGVNPLDHKLRNGALTELFPLTLPYVTGSEVAGVVEEVGEGVTEWRPGDEVFGLVHSGGYAEHALVEAGKLVRKPATLGWEEAAAIPAAAETAWRVLDLLGVGNGQTLLVHGAAGGVGTLLLQFARSRGIRVIGTASEANHAHLRELGAVPVAYGDGLAERVRAAAPEGVDKVLDAAGQGDVLPFSIELAGGAEHVLTIADWEGAAAHGVRFTGGAETVHYHGPALAGALALHEEGTLRLPLHRVFPLAEAAEAQQESERGHLRGKIVLTVG
ncbi:NADP-dependent oxidoreductase [Streptomyces sp. CB01881]|uniref:NADP-dependent oxidoreductase n=1 Tax=Streptomyces sp. CB01881 TaxID=2078691 RepID=UPI000CDC8927|nr:NADP-dependent oxidoreductase [Streptomyces sp. CB01881]AUY49118.1 NADPH:quinone reductase [Streptomyces sp. CB01881]TYC77612.1 NADP-dependent oxidoreductase [Streptomyces sp. CB01881]